MLRIYHSARLFFKDFYILPFLFGSLIALIAIWYYVVSNISPELGNTTFLHYNVIFGVDLAGPWWKIYFYAGIGSFFFLLNMLISFFFYGRDKFLSRLVAILNLLILVFLFVALKYIVDLNLF